MLRARDDRFPGQRRRPRTRSAARDEHQVLTAPESAAPWPRCRRPRRRRSLASLLASAVRGSAACLLVSPRLLPHGSVGAEAAAPHSSVASAPGWSTETTSRSSTGARSRTHARTAVSTGERQAGRCCRGRGYRFCLKASDEFDVILCDRVQPSGERRFTSRHRVVPLDELLLADVTNQFLRSKALTPSLPDPADDWDWSAACSLNGLIGFQRALGSRPPNMGIVPSVEHRVSGERVEHGDYDRLFQAIKRRVRRTSPTT